MFQCFSWVMVDKMLCEYKREHGHQEGAIWICMGGRYNLREYPNEIISFLARGEIMRQPAADEKISTVMLYTPTMLVRGDLILRESIKVSIWLRTQGVPNFIHLLNAQIVQLASGAPKTYSKEEAFVPTPEVMAFHLAPPAHDPLDYDASEANRRMQLVQVLMGSFVMKANMRLSTATDVAASLDVMNAPWISLYEAEVTNPAIPQFAVNVPMLLARPSKVMIGLM